MKNKDHFKQAIRSRLGSIKSKKELSDPFQELFKEMFQELLQAGMDKHLDYERHAANNNQFANSRNGKSSKKAKTKYASHTSRIVEHIEQWNNRRLESVYMIVGWTQLFLKSVRT